VTLKYNSEPQKGGLSRCCVLALLGGLGVAAALVALSQRPAPAPVRLLVAPYQFPLPFRERVDRWIPPKPSWAWARHLEDLVFGRRKPVIISAQVVSLADISPAALSGLSLGSPTFTATNGLQVWLLDAAALKLTRQRLDKEPGFALVARPTISAADGSECLVSTGQTVPINGSTSVGLSLRCLARLHSSLIDLTTAITYSELVDNDAAVAGSNAPPPLTIQTNLDAALRLRIPKGRGVVVLDPGSADSRHKHIGVLIDPLQPAP
jgi:hypothetical protein